MTIIGHIRSGYRRQRQLVAAILAAQHSGQDAGRLFDLLCDEIESQAAAKEQIFYAALIALPGGPALSRRAVQAHDAAAVLIGEISALEPGSETWCDGIAQLAQMIDDHAAAEAEALTQAERLLALDQAAQLGARYLAARDGWIDSFGRVPAPCAPAPAAAPHRSAPALPARPRGWFQKLGHPLRFMPRRRGVMTAALRERRPATDFEGDAPPPLRSRSR